MENIEQIAKTCHAVHLAYCKSIGRETQPEWEYVSNEHKDTLYNSIRNIIHGSIQSSEESHNNFVRLKNNDGWSYSETYSLEDKTNPRLANFNELNIEDRTKENLFFECVKSFL